MSSALSRGVSDGELTSTRLAPALLGSTVCHLAPCPTPPRSADPWRPGSGLPLLDRLNKWPQIWPEWSYTDHLLLVWSGCQLDADAMVSPLMVTVETKPWPSLVLSNV